MQRCPVLRAGFGQSERTFGKVESGEIAAARERCAWRAPVEATRDHQMEYKPEIALYSDGDAFADTAQFAHDAAFCIRDGRLRRAKEEWTRQTNVLERLARDARI